MNLYTSHKLAINLCPEKLKTNLLNWNILNPQFNFVYVDDEGMKNWMLSNVNDSVMRIFNDLKTGAGKADLYRLCRIYAEGGVWVDADVIAIDILKQNCIFLDLFKKVDVVLIKSRYYNNPRFTIVSGNLNNLLFKKTIDMVVQNCNYAKNYLRVIPNTVHLTGPEVYKNVICTMFNLFRAEDIELDKVYSSNDCSFVIIDDITLDSSNVDKPDAYKGYAQDLVSMGVMHHLQLPGI